MSRYKVFLATLAIAFTGSAAADQDFLAKYLANAGVLIVHGETKIVFDPLFDEDFGTFELVPEDIEQALFAGAPPFDGLDAVFVSHHHDDHFSPESMLELLFAHPDLQLFAPPQAIDGMPAEKEAVADRLHAVDLGLADTFTQTIGGIEVSAVRIPHSGWPDRHENVENIAFRVSLDEAATVVHMGDAHTDPAFYDTQAEYWAERATHLALPPYWFFLSERGSKVLDDHIRAGATIGVHVPAQVPDSPSKYPPELKGRTLFSVPGEEKRIPLPGEAE